LILEERRYASTHRKLTSLADTYLADKESSPNNKPKVCLSSLYVCYMRV
jgi:hypothetical protein